MQTTVSHTAAYSHIAPLYDAWVRAPGYAAWIAALARLARDRGMTGKRVLDVGCGTGLSTQPLVELGFAVTGCEPDPAMLAVARRRLGGGARLLAGGLPVLPEAGEFDLVLAANDVVNHLLDPDELGLGIEAMAASLARGGLVVFDATTLAGYRSFFTRTDVRERPEGFFVWRGLAGAGQGPGARFEGALDVFAGGRRFSARFAQRHHPDADVRAALAAAGLRRLAVLGQHADGRRDADAQETVHIKRIYVARRS